LRRLLFSKWFFGLLFFVLLFDLFSDISEHVMPEHYQALNCISILFDSIGLILVLWMLIDLSRRRPETNGKNPHRG